MIVVEAEPVPAPLAVFEEHRGLLHGIAYRMLGSAADAEDVLQEARLRWLAVAHAEVASPRALLVTIVSRLCLDQLGSARVRRETYVGEWLPEPVATGPDADPDTLSMAFMVLLERLAPAERAAFLLAEVFDYSHAEVAAILGKSEEACRQLAARARRHVKEARPRPVDREAHARTLGAFMAARAGRCTGPSGWPGSWSAWRARAAPPRCPSSASSTACRRWCCARAAPSPPRSCSTSTTGRSGPSTSSATRTS